MLDLVHQPTRVGARQDHALAADPERTAGAWTCSLVPNPPGAVLLVRHADDASARDVEVLLDGAPAKEHPSVYVAPTAAETLPPGRELEHLCVLVRGAPAFETVEVRWTDAGGRRHAWRCGTTSPAFRSLI